MGIGLLLAAPAALPARAQPSVARQWNEECLDAIRIDFPAPTVHARNLFHLSVAMYDAWAAYEADATGALVHEAATAADLPAARAEAISYAAFGVLRHRYALAIDPDTTLAALTNRMSVLGYDPAIVATTGPTPAAVGNRVAAAVLAFGLTDGSNEQALYVDTTGYQPVNQPLDLTGELAFTMDDPNRWQPLAFAVAMTQNGLETDKVQRFVGAHWGYVTPFALQGAWSDGVYAMADPGAPPFLGDVGDASFTSNNVAIIRFSSTLNPDSGEVINLSPGARGNNTLGANDGTGHPLNPATGEAYAPAWVKHGDYGRVLAEFWADGPASETPPGHWNTLANAVSDHPSTIKQIEGAGPVVDDLEWDIKLYFALNAALHDAAVAAWGVKRRYDYVRPISSIRYMGRLGQSSDPGLAPYHPQGLPLVPGLIEVVTPASSAPGQRHAHLNGAMGKIGLYCWPGEPADPEFEYSGSAWILAEEWLPYQRATFVTPAFAGYVSGHSAFSRAAAEVLTAFTGSPWFPGGMATHTAPVGNLEFEAGPSETIILQWATYFDAADEAGLSRLYGGIHVPADDGPGRILGSRVGQAAYAAARTYWDPAHRAAFTTSLVLDPGASSPRLCWRCMPEFQYLIEHCALLPGFSEAVTALPYPGFQAAFSTAPATDTQFFRVVRQ